MLDPCRERRVGNTKASNHADPLRTARMRSARKVELRTATSSACTAVHESRCCGASARAVPLPTPTARSPPMVCSVPKCCRRCRWPLSSCSHHWPAYLPNAGIERGGEHGSFMRGDEASSSMKGCSLCMYIRCVRALRASARDICSTLPARRVDLSRFTMSVRRRYLLCSDASRDLIRVWMGTWSRLAT